MIKKLKIIIKPFLHLKFLLSFGLAWIITNGWCYIAFGFAVWLHIGWLKAVAGSYMAFLYLPFTFEKLITIPLAIFFQTKLFPHDVKLHQELIEMKKEVHNEWHAFKFKTKWLKHRKWLV